MSKVRGVFPLFLTTGFGVASGLYIFGPAFKEQQKEREAQARSALEVAEKAQDGQLETLIEAEAAASRAMATESALRPVQPSNSWWQNLGLWTQGGNTKSQSRQNEALQKKEDEETPNTKI